MNHKNLFKLLARAWSVVRHQPMLWIIGLLASLTISTGILEASVNNLTSVIALSDYFNQLKALYSSLASGDFANIFSSGYGFFSGVTPSFFTIISCLVIIYIAIIAQISFIKIVSLMLSGQKNPGTDKILPAANKDFFGALIIHLLYRGILLIVFIATSLPLFLALISSSASSLILSSIFFILVYWPIALFLSFMRNLAITHRVIRSQSSWVDAVHYSWHQVTTNLHLSFEAGIMLMITQILFAIITILIVAIIGMPAALISSIFLSAGQITILAIFLTLVFLVLSLIIILAQGLFSAYYLTVWTSLYHQFNQPSPEKIIEMIINKIAYGLGRLFGKGRQIVTSPKTKANVKQAIKYVEKKKPDVEKFIAGAYNLAKKEVKIMAPKAKKLAINAEKEFEKRLPEIKRTVKAVVRKAKKNIQKTKKR